MSRLRSIAALRRRTAYWVLLLALALGPVGLGAALDTLNPASCSDSCDCDAIHAAHASANDDATAAADDDCGGECPPDCPDCACCPGLAPGLHLIPRIDFTSSPSLPAPRLAAASPAAGDLPDLFRPPRRLA